MPFGSRLKNLLQARNLSQVNFASSLGISRGRLSNYIAGRSEPSYETLRSIATRLQVSTDYLLGLEKVDENNSVLQSFSDISPGASRPNDEGGPLTWIPLYEARPTAPNLETGNDARSTPEPAAWLQVEERHTTPAAFRQSYALLVSDDSMHPQLRRGDVVFIRPVIYSHFYLMASNPGDIFAVRLHPSDKVGVSLKHCFQKDDILVISGSNAAYAPVLFDMQKILFVPIMGRAISMTRSYLDMWDALKI